MANPPAKRKRVHALRRAPDGSAFEKCNFCGVSVAIALADMHDCKSKAEHKRFKAAKQNQNPKVLNVGDQSRSPFCFFMESFRKTHELEDWLAVDRKGFETWKNMTTEERSPFVLQSEKVNSAYEKVLLKEVEELELQVDDESDSLNDEKFDLDHGFYKDWDSSGSGQSSFSIRSEGFDSSE
ncbi:high mobility group B protein 7-like isoform X3 [Macadamia integrifolia]|nr:high mobility group B protein 7-like isoform X2 [Macadamia integrifolia]XP_042482896.1 high mobility group B protein 7-like isoform X3 [Macadamia integrifolia]